VAVRVVHDGLGELVVVKPAGLPCELPRDPFADSLLRRLAEAGATGLRLVHRLDAAACGLVLVARTPAAAAFHAAQIAARRWRKWYVARVALPPTAAQALVGSHKAYLKTDGRVARVVRAGGKPSFLDVVAAMPVPGSATDSHVLVALHTGRYHQIRVMLATLGAALCGDTRYGAPPGPFVLEHVVLGATPYGSADWTVWRAPAHPDRAIWDPELSAAVDRVAATARTAPPLPAPGP
jgi:tRNA pseudouridine32 synthase/23S rRNA pseudouridine746 synthase